MKSKSKKQILATIKDLENQIIINLHDHNDAYYENDELEVQINQLKAELASM